MSLIEQIDKGGVGPKHRSIIDRCMGDIYRRARKTGEMPTLTTLREELLLQPEEIAKEIALSLELYTVGSLDIFGHESNVDLNKRVVVFDNEPEGNHPGLCAQASGICDRQGVCG